MKKILFSSSSILCILALLFYYSCTSEDQLKDSVQVTEEQNASFRLQNNSKTLPNTFAGNEGTFITLQQANEFTGNFQTANPNATRGYFFGKDKLRGIMDQTDCVGLRLYSGIQVMPDQSKKSNLVVYGVKANMDDIADGLIMDFSKPCPSDCGSSTGEIVFNGTEGTYINSILAQSFTNQFQSDNPSATKGYFFGSQKLNDLLNQESSVGIRFYSGIQVENNKPKSNLVLYGVDATGNDLDEGLILEFSSPCPPFCGTGGGGGGGGEEQ